MVGNGPFFKGKQTKLSELFSEIPFGVAGSLGRHGTFVIK